MSYFPLNSVSNALPVQMLPLKQKNKEWKKKCMDALEAIGRLQFNDSAEMRENYRMVNNEILYGHYVYSDSTTDLAQAATEAYALPPSIRNYDIINKTVKILSGEYSQRPDTYRVAAIDPFANNEYLEAKTELVKSMTIGRIQKVVERQLMEEGFDLAKSDFASQEEAEQYQQQINVEREKLTPESVETYMAENYRGIGEKWGEVVLKLDKQRFNTPEMEVVEFEDMLICDRAFRHFYLKANGLGYGQETWNPLRVFFHKSPDVKYVEDGDYVGRVFFMSIPEIINRYGHKMTSKQLEQLYGDYLDKNKQAGGVEGAFFQATHVPFTNYPEYARTIQAFGFDPHTGRPSFGPNPGTVPQDIDVLFGTSSASTSFNMTGLILCTEAYWKSQCRQGFLVMQDPETGEIIEELVDETVELPDYVVEVDDDPSEEDLVFYPQKFLNTIRWTWVNRTWEGTKINVTNSDNEDGALYLNVQEMPFQFKGDSNPYEVKLPVCGAIFNNRNAASMSLVSMAKSWQILYNIFQNRIFQLSCTDMGKLLAVDPRIIPQDKGWGGERNLQKWLSITRDSKIAQLDTSPANRAGSGNQPPIMMLDMSLFDEIKATIEISNAIEQQFLMQVGVTLQRLGQSEGTQTATGVKENLRSSFTQTESWFTRFSNYIKRVKQMNLDIAQYCSATNRDQTLSLIQDDTSRTFIQVAGTDLLLSQLAVYVFSSQELLRQTEMLKTLVTTRNTTDTPLSSLAEVIYSDSPSRIITALRKGEEALRKKYAEERAHAEKIKQMELDADQRKIEEEHQWQSQENQLDREAKLREKAISVMNFDEDVQNNGQIDALAAGSLQVELGRLQHDKVVAYRESIQKTLAEANKQKVEKEKLKSQKDLQDKEHALKKQEMANKLEVERAKKDQIETQNKSQEKMAKEAHAVDLKLADKQLELKDKDIELKKMALHVSKKTAAHDIAGSADDLTTTKALNQEKVKQVKAVNKLKLATQKKLDAKKVKNADKPNKPTKSD